MIDFTTFILSIASAAFVGLGITPDPTTTNTSIDLDMANHNIHLLEMLKEKTKNNLNYDENKLIESLLYETRIRFLEVQKTISTKKE